MKYSDLLSQLKEWEKHHPELLENPALFISFDSEDEEPIEIDNIEHWNNDGEQNHDIPTTTYLILTP